MDKIGFVILHYLTIEDTKKSINSIIENCHSKNYVIIVVDNCSPNGTGKILKNKYKSDNVEVYLNSKNEGFSKGNNVGFRIAKEKYGCNFIVLMNNDTKILQDNFDKKIIDNYYKTGYGVLGPMIIDPSGQNNSNPMRIEEYTLQNAISDKNMWKKLYIKSLLGLEKFHPFMKQSSANLCEKIKKVIDIPMENVMLHGCFLVFSPLYIQKYDGIDEKTFLYGEEHMLYLRMKADGLLMRYDPQFQIFHAEAATTSKTIDTQKRKKINYLMWKAHSAIVDVAYECEKTGDIRNEKN